MKKIFVTMILTLALCLSFTTVTVSADDSDWKILQGALSGGYGSSASYPCLTYNAWSSSGINYITINLLADITCLDQEEGPLVVPENAAVTLNMNGHTIDRNVGSTAIENGYVIQVANNAGLSVKGGTIKGGNNTAEGGGICNEGTFNLENTTISNNSADKGGGIYTTGFVGYTNGIITNCSANKGGAAYSAAGGRFETSNGTITDCSAADGGAVYVEEGGVATFANRIALSGCTAENNGGAIYSEGAVGLETATVSDCSVISGNGGGIYIKNSYIFTGKDAKVTDNTKGDDSNNLYLCDDAKAIMGTGADVPAPTSGMKIGVTMQTPGVFTNNIADGYKDYFTSDDSEYSVIYNSEKKLMLSKPCKVSFVMGGHGSQIEEQTVDSGFCATEPVKPTEKGFEFAGWYEDSGLTRLFDFGTVISEDTVLYAKWVDAASPDDPEEPESKEASDVDTGDENNVLPYGIAMIVALGGIAVASRKRREN